MLTYQARERVFAFRNPQDVSFPCTCEIRFKLQPAHPFGMARGGGRTAVRAVEATIFFDANTGRHSIESGEPLTPLRVDLNVDGYAFRFEGFTLVSARSFRND